MPNCTKRPRKASPSNILALAAMTVAAGILADAAPAQTAWTGAEDSDWDNPNNWSDGLPGTGGVTIISRDQPGASNIADNLPLNIANQPEISGTDPRSAVATIFIGSLAGAELSVTNGAELLLPTSSGSILIGTNTINNRSQNRLQDQSGTLRATGAGTSVSASDVTVAYRGSGTLDFSDGATLSLVGPLTAAALEGSEARLRFSGSGTEADLSSAVFGGLGNAIVSVTDGAIMSTNAATIGDRGTGTVDIIGAGSAWQTRQDNLVIGSQDGSEGTLNIREGGAVSAANRVVLGSGGGATGTLNVDGDGSELASGELVVVGANFTNGSTEAVGRATISNGGRLEGQILMGWNANSRGELSVTGADTAVDVNTYLMVGFQGNATLSFSDGAVLRARDNNTTPPLMIAFANGSTGTVNIGAASGQDAAGAGTIDLAQTRFGNGTGELVFNHTTENYVYASDIMMDPSVDANTADPSRWTISHLAGDTTMTGNNGGFLGTTNVDGGTLLVNNALGGRINVRSLGTFGGSGTVNDLNVSSGGTVSPDGTLTVEGNAEFDAGSTFLVNADQSGADLLSVAGQLDLRGGTVRHQEGTGEIAPLSQHRIAVANGGISGTFDGVQSDLAFLLPELSYTQTEIWLELLRNDVDFADIALSPNQRGVANVLGALEVDTPLVRQILSMSAPSARLAYDQMAGEIHGSRAAASTQDMTVFLDLLQSRLWELGQTATPAATTRNRAVFSETTRSADLGFWMEGLGARSEFDGNGNASATDRGFGGFALGYDQQLANGAVLGFTAGFSNSSVRNDLGASSDAESTTLGVYISSGTGSSGLQVSGGALVSWHSVETVRSLSGLGSGPAIGRYDAQSYSVFAEASYQQQINQYMLEPFFRLSHIGFSSDAFTETGSNTALTVGEMATDTSFAALGLRGSTQIDLGGAPALLTGQVGWRHAFGTVEPVQNAVFQGNALEVSGMPIAQNEFLFGASLEFNPTDRATIHVGYSGRLADDFSDQQLSLGMRIEF